MTSQAIGFDLLLRLRLTVARYGEMDVARWWNTNGQLGRLGATVPRRGFPRTLPTLLFYPGHGDGAAGLRFTGVLAAEHNCRPKIF